jgi:hypothetical protein
MYKPHQVEASDKALALLKKNGIVAIFGLPRTGKTRTAIRTAIEYGAKHVLVLTKKAAIDGWKSEWNKIDNYGMKITITNYEQINKVEGEFDLVVIDEAHNLGSRGKPTKRVKDIRAVCYKLPAIFLTGTPTIETPLGIYHQWCITKHSPFNKYKNFYQFFRDYGIPDPVWIGGRSVEQYKKAKDTLLPIIEQYAVRVSQEDAGIKHQAQDVVHTVTLTPATKHHLKGIEEEGTLRDILIFDTDMGVRTAIHQVEAGAVLYNEELLLLPNTEVVEYLLETFGDDPDVALFTHFRSTRKKLRHHFKKAQMFSSIADAEGTDMSHMKHMVVVNTGYSGAKAAQLRERLVNMNRTTEALVHYIVTDAGVSRDVYDAVSQKVNYNLAAFRKRRG